MQILHSRHADTSPPFAHNTAEEAKHCEKKALSPAVRRKHAARRLRSTTRTRDTQPEHKPFGQPQRITDGVPDDDRLPDDLPRHV